MKYTSTKGLTINELKVLLHITFCVPVGGRDTHNVVKAETAIRTDLAEDTVSKLLKSLEAKGFIKETSYCPEFGGDVEYSILPKAGSVAFKEDLLDIFDWDGVAFSLMLAAYREVGTNTASGSKKKFSQLMGMSTKTFDKYLKKAVDTGIIEQKKFTFTFSDLYFEPSPMHSDVWSLNRLLLHPWWHCDNEKRQKIAEILGKATDEVFKVCGGATPAEWLDFVDPFKGIWAGEDYL